MNSLSWKPIRRGPIFCSPACGNSCLHANYVKAHKDAKNLIKQMKTTGWNVHVWENLGWHWRINKLDGLLSVSGDPKTGYNAMLSTSLPGTCDSIWYDPKYFKDPNKAVAHRITVARGILKPIQALLFKL